MKSTELWYLATTDWLSKRWEPLGSGRTVGNSDIEPLLSDGQVYGHFATSFLIVLVLRIVNGTRSTFPRGRVEKSEVPGFLRRHQ